MFTTHNMFLILSVASSPPYNVIMVAGSASSITLTWNIPMSSNGIITHYNVSSSS